MIAQSLKKIFLILSILFIFSYCCTHKSKESNIKIQVSIIDKIRPSRYINGASNCYFVNIDIINNSDSTIKFWTMSCSWGENWVSNNNNLHVHTNPCDNNMPILNQIVSGQKMTYKGVLCVEDTLKVLYQSDFKLGLIIVKESEYGSSLLSCFSTVLDKKIKERKDIIWSEPFKITK